MANALLRGDSRLEHFHPQSVADSSVGALMQRIRVKQAYELDEVGHTAARLTIDRSGHPAYSRSTRPLPGFPATHYPRTNTCNGFGDCLSSAGQGITAEQESSLVASVNSLQDIDDIRTIIKQLSPGH